MVANDNKKWGDGCEESDNGDGVTVVVKKEILVVVKRKEVMIRWRW